MPELFRCTDPWGREIVLSLERWRDHVLGGHPELAGHEALLEAALTRPSYVNRDAVREDREAFYAPSPLPPPYGRSLVKVVVEFGDAGSDRPTVGRVITAYFANKPRPRERRIWP